MVEIFKKFVTTLQNLVEESYCDSLAGTKVFYEKNNSVALLTDAIRTEIQDLFINPEVQESFGSNLNQRIYNFVIKVPFGNGSQTAEISLFGENYSQAERKLSRICSDYIIISCNGLIT